MVFFSYQRLGFDKCLLARSLFDTAQSVPPLERSPALDALLADLQTLSLHSTEHLFILEDHALELLLQVVDVANELISFSLDLINLLILIFHFIFTLDIFIFLLNYLYLNLLH